MIRLLILVLVAANVLVFAWSRWMGGDQPRLVTPPANFVAGTSLATPEPQAPACTTIGPFTGETAALEVEQLLRDMQLDPTRRTATGPVHDGWWVYVPAPDAAAQARTLRALQLAGIRDAVAMPDDPAFRVSVGVFREAEGANSRAAVVRAEDLDATVEERTVAGEQFWFDLPGLPRERIDIARLRAEGVAVEELSVEECQSAAAGEAAQAAEAG